jgi:hypothetical protein
MPVTTFPRRTSPFTPAPAHIPREDLGCPGLTRVRRPRSGKGARLPEPPPLRTVHAPFGAYGSSIGQRIREDTRVPHWPWGNLDGTTPEPATELPAVAGAAPATTIAVAPTVLLCSLRRLADSSRPPTPEGSRPACAGGDTTPIRPITDRPSLAPSSCTRSPSALLTIRFPLRGGYGLTTFRRRNRAG